MIITKAVEEKLDFSARFEPGEANEEFDIDFGQEYSAEKQKKSAKVEILSFFLKICARRIGGNGRCCLQKRKAGEEDDDSEEDDENEDGENVRAFQFFSF